MNWDDRTPSDQPVTFADLLSNHELKFPRRVMTREQFEALPRKTDYRCDLPDGWEKTGYLQAYNLGKRHRFWVYIDFIKRNPDGSDEQERYLVVVDNDFVIEAAPERF